jgi:high-affinity nickel permease
VSDDGSLIVVLHAPRLISTAALSYSLGLRHALDADHISCIGKVHVFHYYLSLVSTT